MYVSAALVFFGICLATASCPLLACLVIMLVLQHFMILAEERICRLKYGASYREYSEKVPRYLFFRTLRTREHDIARNENTHIT